MLERITIKNYAVIDNLSLNFQEGFSVFTGETGAGKSVLIGALGLLLGARSDSSMIRSGSENMSIEGVFSIDNNETIEFLSSFHIDSPEELIIRREINQQGKNRVFINGNQETLSKLESIGAHLADMHGQHDHQLLLNRAVHRDILDSFGSLQREQEQFSNLYHCTIKKLEEKKLLEQNAEKIRQDKDFYSNAHQEISLAQLKENEEVNLEQELAYMQNKEKISEALFIAHEAISNGDINAIRMIEDSVRSLQSITSFSPKYDELAELLNESLASLRESSHLLSSYVIEGDFDAQSMDDLLDRIALLKDFKRKYQKQTIEELNQFAEECEHISNQADNLDEQLIILQKESETLLQELKQQALSLSKIRQEFATEMSAKIEEELSYLGMESAKFEVKITYMKDPNSFFVMNDTTIQISEKGIDKVEFMISPNLGEESKSLTKIASGGEISRIMLSIKSALAKSDPVGTGVFDEIDAGIGGMIAHHVALKMQEIAQLRQIFCITHLAQIASKADHHYHIKKTTDGQKTYTSVSLLSKEDRIKEIARMLGGDSANSESLAKEMLGY